MTHDTVTGSVANGKLVYDAIESHRRNEVEDGTLGVFWHHVPAEGLDEISALQYRLLTMNELTFMVVSVFFDRTEIDILRGDLSPSQIVLAQAMARDLHAYLVAEHFRPFNVQHALDALVERPITYADAQVLYEQSEAGTLRCDREQNEIRLLTALIEYARAIPERELDIWFDGASGVPAFNEGEDIVPVTNPYTGDGTMTWWFASLRIGAAPDLDFRDAFLRSHGLV